MGNLDNIAAWRERTFSSLMSVVILVGAVSTIAIFPVLLHSGMWHVVIADTVALAWMVGIWRLKNLKYAIRVYNFLVVVYVLAIILMITVGSISLSYLLGPPLIAAILLNLRAALIATGLGVAALIVAGATELLDLNVAGWGHAPLKSSLAAAVNYSTVSVMLSLMCSTLLSGLSRSLGELELTSAAASKLNDMVLIFATSKGTNSDRPIIFVNDAFLQRTGHEREQVLGRDLRILQGPSTDAVVMTNLLNSMPWCGSPKIEMIGYTKAGAEFWLELEVVPFTKSGDSAHHWVVVSRDITDRRTAEQSIHRLAFYDVLTGLPNRRLLMERLTNVIRQSSFDAAQSAVLYLDVDNFKKINDQRGHATGDLLLEHVAVRLKETVRGSDLVARLGGDEFVIVLDACAVDTDAVIRSAREVANKVRATLATPFVLEGQPYRVSASIGIALVTPGTSPNDLLREADTAMYYAKARGRDSAVIFNGEMLMQVQHKLTLERDLGMAFDARELTMYLQLQIDQNGSAVGAELLMRWRRPDGTMVRPDLFIPAAESSGLIIPLGQWALIQACEIWLALERSGNLIHLSINVSPLQFRQQNFVDYVRTLLATTGVPPHYLIFEVTEGLFIDDIDQTISRMHDLAKLGIRFSVDDFGTGYSNLTYLAKMPLYELKIDKSFIRNIPNDPTSSAIVHSVVAMAGHLGLQVVAEGVESIEHVHFLAQHDQVIMQGFHFHRPAPLYNVITHLQGLDFARRNLSIPSNS
ncbi:diguanylate cyclase (GGDEF)-like protein/PAS domain S-box-containing protein [Massilia aurea]|uniref:Diguanylate cyclase (GGDEF)-like protein/PAS domain S-box-containing protein n=1 Tax=Massilia aurea TaxID=373040 RepID=A0A7W9WXK8_9BURK|nr:EAL domain-containing protein [Massilia aurea]MBB6132661.1 diguanylate cyclase (GGDEF)-like protein/PAS domain S-box-containing protein [Massilia aurea]